MQIQNPQQAVSELQTHVQQIAESYDEAYREDIEQACWLAIFKLLEEGEAAPSQLVARAAGEAKTEYRNLTGNGMRPLRSKVKPPKRVHTNWVGNQASKRADEEWPEPSYVPREDDTDQFIRELRRLAKSTIQRRCVEAVQLLAAIQREDPTIRIGLPLLSAQVGASRWKCQRAMRSLLNRYQRKIDARN